MSDEQVEFLPFHAINEFMVAEYQYEVLRKVWSSLGELPADLRSDLVNTFKREAKIPGFRNANLAPAPLKARSSVTIFERDPEFTAAVLDAWARLHPDLMKQVADFLTSREWEVLPADANRRALPGFQTHWPAEENFETLDEAFRKANPKTEVSEDDLNLMIVWVSGRLPYKLPEGEETEAGEQE